jgi:hypothetical protein
MNMALRVARLAVVVGLAIGLGACSLVSLGRPGPLRDSDQYHGPDAATVIVKTAQIDCCYIEGALRFARLDGPTGFEWAVDGGQQELTLKPGKYTLTEWEQVCDGNCGILDPPTNHCTIDFSAAPRATLEILVSFPIPEPCVATLE